MKNWKKQLEDKCWYIACYSDKMDKKDLEKYIEHTTLPLKKLIQTFLDEKDKELKELQQRCKRAKIETSVLSFKAGRTERKAEIWDLIVSSYPKDMENFNTMTNSQAYRLLKTFWDKFKQLK